MERTVTKPNDHSGYVESKTAPEAKVHQPRSLPVELFKEACVAWGNPVFGLEKIIDQYCLDKEALPGLRASLEENLRNHSALFLRDAGGVATHILGLKLFKDWEDKKILTEYKQVLWFPFSKLLRLPVQEVEPSLALLSKLTNPSAAAYSPDLPTLVIITGVDYMQMKMIDTDEFKAAFKDWVSVLTSVKCLAVGNFLPDCFNEINYEVIEVTLPPLTLHCQYKITDSLRESKISIPGDLLAQSLADETRRKFRFLEDNPDGVSTTSLETVRHYLSGATEVVRDTYARVDHAQPIISSADLIRMLAGKLRKDEVKNVLPTLDAPAKWYYASLSALQFHKNLEARLKRLNQKKKFFCYLIAGSLVVRRMTPDSMNYLSDLGLYEQYQLRTAIEEVNTLSAETAYVLECLVESKGLENGAKNITALLKEAKKAWEKKATEERNEQLRAEGKEPPRRPVLWNSLPENVLAESSKVFGPFKKDITDSELTASLKALSDEESDPSYQHIQKRLSHYYQHLPGSAQEKEAALSKLITKVLLGQEIPPEASACRLMAAVTTLAESARESDVFFANFAMLDIMSLYESSKKRPKEYTWQRYVSLPRRVDMADVGQQCWQEQVLADMLDSLGGIHPMAHNGSYRQTQDSDALQGFCKSAVVSRHGVPWSRYKMQLHYFCWLAQSLKESPVGINCKSLGLSPKATKTGYTVLKGNYLYPLIQDLALFRRLHATYDIMWENKTVFAKCSRPFQQVQHLIADPTQIKIQEVRAGVPFFGYYLVVPTAPAGLSAEEKPSQPQLIYLNSYEAYVIAMKLEASDVNEEAVLALYDYVCNRHPQNLEFRYGRALFLVFHHAIFEDDRLKGKLGLDLEFLRQADSFESPALQLQLAYIKAVFKLRDACEDRVNEELPGKVQLQIIHPAIEAAKKLEKKFDNTREETPMLYGEIANAHRKMGMIIERDMAQNSTLRNDPSIRLAARNHHLVAYSYIVKFALTLHRTTYLAQRLNKFIGEVLLEGGALEQFLPDLINSISAPPARENYSTVVRGRWPKHAKFIRSTVSAIIQSFSSEMGGQKNKIEEMARTWGGDLPPSERMRAFARQQQTQLQAFLSNNPSVKVVKRESGVFALVIRFNWEVPVSILRGWGSLHGITFEMGYDAEWGGCLYVDYESEAYCRSDYQPVPHPDSFKPTTVRIKEGEAVESFLQLTALFEECKQRLVNWDPGEDESVSYHLMGTETRLPTLKLVARTDEIFDAVIVLPNSVPIAIILGWLKERAFSYYWLNEETLGRCICITEINCKSVSPGYVFATSNGDLIEKQFKASVDHAEQKHEEKVEEVTPLCSMVSHRRSSAALFRGEFKTPVAAGVALEENVEADIAGEEKDGGATVPKH